MRGVSLPKVIRAYSCSVLEIALDQAHAIVGIEHSKWESCHVEITDQDGRISWEEVTNAA